jgi:hypothetical protein
MSDEDSDRRLREAWFAETVETAELERAIRGRLRPRVWLPLSPMLVAAALVLIGLGLAWHFTRVPAVLAAAERDHRIEVMEQSPRRWRTSDADVDALLARFGARRAADYRLLRAKICGLDGKRVLHLVYTDGHAEYSLFLLPPHAVLPVQAVTQGPEQIESFNGGIAVVAASAEDCHRFVRKISQSL